MSENERSDSGPMLDNYDDMTESTTEQAARISKATFDIKGVNAVNEDVRDKVKKVISDTGKPFNYDPDDIQEELNQGFAMRELEKSWPGGVEDNLKVAKWFVRFAEPDTLQHLESTGLGSHPIMIKAVFDVAKQMEAELARLGKNEDTLGRPMLEKYSELTKKELAGLEIKARELLTAAIHKAEAAIIAKHGPM